MDRPAVARLGHTRARIDGTRAPEPDGLTDRELRRDLNATEHAELARLYETAPSARPPASSCNAAWTWRPPGSASNADIGVPGFPAAPVRAGSSGSWPVAVAEDLLRGQRPAPERPGQSAMPEFTDQGGRRDGDDGTLGVGQAVAARLGKGREEDAGICPASRCPPTRGQGVLQGAFKAACLRWLWPDVRIGDGFDGCHIPGQRWQPRAGRTRTGSPGGCHRGGRRSWSRTGILVTTHDRVRLARFAEHRLSSSSASASSSLVCRNSFTNIGCIVPSSQPDRKH